MTSLNESNFKIDFERHQRHLKLKGLQPKTIDAYKRAMVRIGIYFDYQVSDLSENQLTNYFNDLLETHSWSTVKLDLYGLKFFYQHVLKKNWEHIDLIKPPCATRIPEIVSVEEAAVLFMATNKLSYRVFFFTTYSMGLRLGEGLRLKIGDIDAQRQRVLIRNAKGNKDRLVPLPDMTLNVLRRFWSIHRNPTWLFPNRKGGLKGSSSALTPLDTGGIQTTLRKVVESCGFKKKITPHCLRHSYTTHLIEAGVDLITIQKILGHTNIRTTCQYIHLASNTQHETSQTINHLMNQFSIEWGNIK